MIAVGHHPIFMSPHLYHDTDSSLRFDEITGHLGGVLPQLIDARFDLYLCGHLHVYERSCHPRLTQVMTGGDGIAFPGALEKPNKYSIVAFDPPLPEELVHELIDFWQGLFQTDYELFRSILNGKERGQIRDVWSAYPRHTLTVPVDAK